MRKRRNRLPSLRSRSGPRTREDAELHVHDVRRPWLVLWPGKEPQVQQLAHPVALARTRPRVGFSHAQPSRCSAAAELVVEQARPCPITSHARSPILAPSSSLRALPPCLLSLRALPPFLLSFRALPRAPRRHARVVDVLAGVLAVQPDQHAQPALDRADRASIHCPPAPPVLAPSGVSLREREPGLSGYDPGPHRRRSRAGRAAPRAACRALERRSSK